MKMELETICGLYRNMKDCQQSLEISGKNDYLKGFYIYQEKLEGYLNELQERWECYNSKI